MRLYIFIYLNIFVAEILEQMRSIEIKQEFCPKNHRCPVIPACPFGAISQDGPSSEPSIDDSKCQQCGLCCNFCRVFSCKSPQ